MRIRIPAIQSLAQPAQLHQILRRCFRDSVANHFHGVSLAGSHSAVNVTYGNFSKCGSVAVAHEKGLYRMEGKEYVVKDGDVLLFKFNV